MAVSPATIRGSMWLSWAAEGKGSAQHTSSTGVGVGLRCEVAVGVLGGTVPGAWDT